MEGLVCGPNSGFVVLIGGEMGLGLSGGHFGDGILRW